MINISSLLTILYLIIIVDTMVKMWIGIALSRQRLVVQ